MFNFFMIIEPIEGLVCVVEYNEGTQTQILCTTWYHIYMQEVIIYVEKCLKCPQYSTFKESHFFSTHCMFELK